MTNFEQNPDFNQSKSQISIPANRKQAYQKYPTWPYVCPQLFSSNLKISPPSSFHCHWYLPMAQVLRGFAIAAGYAGKACKQSDGCKKICIIPLTLCVDPWIIRSRLALACRYWSYQKRACCRQRSSWLQHKHRGPSMPSEARAGAFVQQAQNCIVTNFMSNSLMIPRSALASLDYILSFKAGHASRWV